MKSIQIDADIKNYLTSKAATPGEAPSLILRRELHLAQATETIEIDDETYDYLLSKTANLGESASDILRRELKLKETPQGSPGTLVFHIPAGTGSQAWNKREAPLVATVGSTLRIVNDDAVPHRLHTDGSPFPHPGADILPGEAADFLLQLPFDSGQNHPLHDHALGPAAQFWINVLPAG